jgi:hypothetical protein
MDHIQLHTFFVSLFINHHTFWRDVACTGEYYKVNEIYLNKTPFLSDTKQVCQSEQVSMKN